MLRLADPSSTPLVSGTFLSLLILLVRIMNAFVDGDDERSVVRKIREGYVNDLKNRHRSRDTHRKDMGLQVE